LWRVGPVARRACARCALRMNPYCHVCDQTRTARILLSMITGPRTTAFTRSVGVLACVLVPLLTVGCDQPGSDPARNGSGGGGNLTQPRLSADSSWVVFGEDTVTAKVARTPGERERGLMGETRLDEGKGMLFVFEDEAARSFWMRNTVIPLDIAFLDRTQAIVDIRRMEPLSEEFHTSARPAMFALEVPQGWFEANGIAVGTRASIVFGPR
jgi:uncharacterized protein